MLKIKILMVLAAFRLIKGFMEDHPDIGEDVVLNLIAADSAEKVKEALGTVEAEAVAIADEIKDVAEYDFKGTTDAIGDILKGIENMFVSVGGIFKGGGGRESE